MKAWIARDSSGIVGLFGQKPTKGYSIWLSNSDKALLYEAENSFLVPEGVNPQWEDAEPVEVNITVTKARN